MVNAYLRRELDNPMSREGAYLRSCLIKALFTFCTSK